jgi:hypothetical protein
MGHRITRQWKRTGACVSTRHPQLGEMYRGSIYLLSRYARPEPDAQARCTWQVIDQDGTEVGALAGDYLDAEELLLAATAWADEPVDLVELDGPH